MKDRDALDAVRAAAQWFPAPSDGLAERSTDVSATLLDLIGDAQVGMIGEATHGTDEFYFIRAAETPPAALGDFVRFPRWMWRNIVVVEFVEWLRFQRESERAAGNGC